MTFDEIRRTADRVRAVPLEAVLLLTGARRDLHDKAKWHTTQGVLSVTGMKFMNWNRGAGGGGAIDLAMHLNHFGFKAAVAWLRRHFPGGGPASSDRPRLRPTLKLPPQDAGNLARVRRYLVHERGLAPGWIEPLIQSGRLYADRHGNAVFLLLGKENRPVGAELRGIGPHAWRGMAPGSRKDLGYFSVPASDAGAIVLCESAIDAISCAAIHPDHLTISTSGARPNPRWLLPLIRRGHEIYCGFDSDTTGDDMARAMIALHPSVKRLRPTRHDWNDVLTSRP